MNKIFCVIVIFALFSCNSKKESDFDFIGYEVASSNLKTIQDFLKLENKSLKAVEGNYISLGHYEGDVFVKFILEKRNYKDDSVMISFDNPMLNEIVLYDQDGAQIDALGRINYIRINTRVFSILPKFLQMVILLFTPKFKRLGVLISR